jgi:hypothetical protein
MTANESAFRESSEHAKPLCSSGISLLPCERIKVDILRFVVLSANGLVVVATDVLLL